jgi:hypothetical protein
MQEQPEIAAKEGAITPMSVACSRLPPLARLASPTPPRMPCLMAVAPRPRTIRGGEVIYRGPEHDLAFADTTSLSEIGHLPFPHRLLLYPAYAGLPQLPLFDDASLPQEVVDEHYEVALPPDVHVYGLTGHELGGHGLFQANGKVFLHQDIVPTYFNSFVLPQGQTLPDVWGGSLLKSDVEILDVDVPVGFPFHPNFVYGHFLLEILPKLQVLHNLKRLGMAFPIAMSIHLPEWLKRIIALYFDDGEILYYNSETQRIRAPCFILPSMMHRSYHFHPQFGLMTDNLVERVQCPSAAAPAERHRLIYLSRSRISGGWHGILNEAEVEAAMASLGFTIIHPQEHSFAEQIAIYQSADCIACEYSSATHNSLFARRGTGVFCINRINWYQSRIGSLRSQPVAFMPPADGHFRDWRMTSAPEAHFGVDCEQLRRQVAAFLLTLPYSRT